MTSKAAPPDGAPHRRVLIVEDEYLIAVELVEHFQALGAEVVGPAANAQSALALIDREERLDGAVLDILLRGDKVYAVAEALRERGVPFVFVTGYECALIPPDYADQPCFSKPADPHAIAQALFG